MEVCNLVSSAKRYSPNFTQLRHGHRTCSFISHLNAPGSIQPVCHFRRTELFMHQTHKPSLFYQVPTLYTPGSRECTCGQSTLARNTTWLRGSVRELQARDGGFDPRLGWIMLRRCAPRQGTLPTRALSLNPGVSGCLVGRWRLVCFNSTLRRKWQPGCMPPLGVEMAYWINEQVLWPGGNCVKSGE